MSKKKLNLLISVSLILFYLYLHLKIKELVMIFRIITCSLVIGISLPITWNMKRWMILCLTLHNPHVSTLIL